MGRSSNTRKMARKMARDVKKKGPCQCDDCKFDRGELKEGLYVINDVASFVTEQGDCLPMSDIMYQTFRPKKYFDMADGDKVVLIDKTNPHNVAIDNLEIKKNMVCYAEGCSNTENLKRCSVCRNVRYCSAECQKAHWKCHKQCCAPKKKISILPEGYGFKVMDNKTLEVLHNTCS
ncbi:histone-lysine N-methyltransferase / SET domain containing protein [Paramecium bursaria Chlorella virus CVB-1]|nr:histone-lysine N-methyltransferase / SET domain containing protein [Paramecium bursaria Chlorella virus CVB-1]